MDQAEEVSHAATWRHAGVDDLDAIMDIQSVVHDLLPERREVIADKLRHYGDGCLALCSRDGIVLGYGLSHPWRLDEAPALDTIMSRIPDDSDCLFVHDVALLPAARRQGASKAFVERIRTLARRDRLSALALVSVYGTTTVWAALGFELRPVSAMAAKLAAYGETARYMVAVVDARAD
ncbi:GNAT family N-acetyltransferase [Lichenihabitans psoromatis]|uniref:GNAT family N-acetyltransferase n=1 Tax=Lichenihabitans psoromatis TaxID=2528642 RepID=UPI001FE1B023|nr:GNAT family N-acetyltransferase [Lichenihabitans psoromatis]